MTADASPSTRFAFQMNAPAVRDHNLAAERQPEPGTSPGPGSVYAVEAVEQARLLSRGDAAPGIRYFQQSAFPIHADPDADAARLRVLQGILRQVHQHPPQ